MWWECTLPLRSTSESTGSLPNPPAAPLMRLFACLFFSLPPTNAVSTHRLTDAMEHEPRGLVGDADRAVQLVRRHALFARRHETERQHPLVERNVAAFHHRPGGDGERAVAVVAVVEARPVRLALK